MGRRRDLVERIVTLVPAERGSVVAVVIRHEGWCPSLQSDRIDDCCCDPELEVETATDPARPRG